MYEVIVDGESLKDLIFVTDVERTMGPFVKGRIVTIHAYILHDILATVDVLNKLLTGEIQEFIFTDQPDRFWKGKVKEDIKVPSSYEMAKIDIDIEIPDGVSYAVKPRELSYSGRTSLILENNGSDYAYPTFDFKLKDDTYMVSAVSKDKTFQFGEPIEASPIKEVVITKEKTTDGYETTRSYTSIDRRVMDIVPYNSYDVSKINPHWKTAGTFIQRNKSMPAPSNGKVKVGKWATYWQTGERMSSWVKGRTFPVAQTKNVRQSKSSKAYLLTNRGVYIGWLLEQDIDGASSSGFAANNNNATDFVANFASNQGYYWHGPAKKIDVGVDCTNFQLETYFSYFIKDNSQYGAYYVGVMSGDSEIMGMFFSTHKNNRITTVNFEAYGRGLQGSGASSRNFASNFWGKLTMTKRDDKLEFIFNNDMDKRTYSRSYNIADKKLQATHIVIWAGKYANNPGPFDMAAIRLKFTGLNSKVYIKPKTETFKEVFNIPDPRYKFSAGDTIRLEMETNKAYVNGIETLSPIAFGSDNVKLKPGQNEIMFDISSDVVPDIDVFYRERFK